MDLPLTRDQADTIVDRLKAAVDQAGNLRTPLGSTRSCCGAVHDDGDRLPLCCGEYQYRFSLEEVRSTLEDMTMNRKD